MSDEPTPSLIPEESPSPPVTPEPTTPETQTTGSLPDPTPASLASEETQETPSFRALLGEDGSFRPDADWSSLTKHLGVEKYTKALSRYKTPEELLKGMGNLQGLVGTDTRGVIVPNSDSSEDVVAAFKEAVGAPGAPEAYEIELGELPENVRVSDDVLDKAKQIAHKHHMTPAALQELVQLTIENSANSATQQQEEFTQQVIQRREEQLGILKKEWGGDLDKNINLAKRVGIQQDIPLDDPVFSSANGVRLLVAYAKTQREDSLPITGRDHAVDVRSDFEEMVRNPNHPQHTRYHNDPEFARQQSARLQRALAQAKTGA